MAQREFDKVNIKVEFNEAETRQQINSGESVSTLFGKIKKIFSDLKTVAFTGDYNDLNNKPNDIVVDDCLSETSENLVKNKVVAMALADKANKSEIVSGVKGETEAEYRKGNITITKESIGINTATDITSTSDNSTLPTSKAVYDCVKNNNPESINVKYSSAILYRDQTIGDLKNGIINWWESAKGSADIFRFNGGTYDWLLNNWVDNDSIILPGAIFTVIPIADYAPNTSYATFIMSTVTSNGKACMLKTSLYNGSFTNLLPLDLSTATTITINSSNNTVPTSKAVYNYIEPLKSKLDAFAIEHYAFTIDQNESNPASMIAYPAGCDNTNFASAKMNYTTDVFDYGSWGNAFFIKNLKVVMLNYDGTEAYEINKNDYSKKIDGTDVGEGGNVMIAFPKTYYKVVDNGDNAATIHVSNRKLDDNYKCWAHIGLDGSEQDYCYMAAYDGSYVDNKLRSLSGYAPMVSQTAQEEVNRALANNSDSDKKNWYTGVAADRLLVQILLTLISKNTNSQAAFGYGFANENSAAISSGAMDTKGLFWGESGGKQGVKVFGIENFWGNVWKRTAGWINANGSQKLKMTYGTQDGSSVTGYNFDGTGYVAVNTCPTSGWLKGMTFHQFGFFPETIGGSNSTYYADYFYANNNQVNYAVVGGVWGDDTYAGAFYLHLSYPTSAVGTIIGTSLSYKKGG